MNNDENYQDFFYDWSTRTIIAVNYGAASGSIHATTYTSDNTAGYDSVKPQVGFATTGTEKDALEFLRGLNILLERGPIRQVPITPTRQVRHWTIKEKGKLA